MLFVGKKQWSVWPTITKVSDTITKIFLHACTCASTFMTKLEISPLQVKLCTIREREKKIIALKES